MLVSGLRDELRARPGPDTLWLWHAAYPRPLPSIVSLAAEESAVEPAQVYATMRQESGYAPHVVSGAGATGLMQIMPQGSAALAKRLGIEVGPRMLQDPSTNIRLGIAEIASARKAFGGNLPLSIAAYNAGVAQVRRWLGETGEVDLDLFIERIPYDETRNYVRRVVSHYARYRYLEDGGGDGWPVDLPDRVGPDPRPASE